MALSYFSVPLLPRGHLVCMKKGSRHFFPAQSPLRSRSPDRGQHPPRYVLIVCAFLSHLPRLLLRGELAWSILPGKPHGQRERSDRAAHANSLRIPVHAAQSPPRQAGLEEVGRPERFPRSLLSV